MLFDGIEHARHQCPFVLTETAGPPLVGHLYENIARENAEGELQRLGSALAT
jgi:hypothetical protein